MIAFFAFFRRKKKKKKSYPLSFPILGGRNSTRALQSSPLQNPWGYPERDIKEGQTEEILVSNIGFSDIHKFSYKTSCHMFDIKFHGTNRKKYYTKYRKENLKRVQSIKAFYFS